MAGPSVRAGRVSQGGVGRRVPRSLMVARVQLHHSARVKASTVRGAENTECRFSLIRRSHSISFTRAQGIPKYKTGFGRGKGWESWDRLVEGGGGGGGGGVTGVCTSVALHNPIFSLLPLCCCCFSVPAVRDPSVPALALLYPCGRGPRRGRHPRVRRSGGGGPGAGGPAPAGLRGEDGGLGKVPCAHRREPHFVGHHTAAPPGGFSLLF